MGMRSGQPFGDVSTEVMADVDLLNEAMSKEIAKTRKRQAGDDSAPSATRQKTTHWGQGNSHSKGSKGNQKGGNHKGPLWTLEVRGLESAIGSRWEPSPGVGTGPVGTARGR